MVESLGLQQVLQLSSTVEKAQVAQQTQGTEQARAFDKELEKIVEHKRDQTQETKEIENAKIREEDQRKQQNFSQQLAQPSSEEADEKESEEPESAAPSPESDQGKLINIVA